MRAQPTTGPARRDGTGSSDSDWNRLIGIGDVHAGADNMVSALEYYERALARIRRAGAPEPVAISVEIKMADCLCRRGVHPEAKERLQSMLQRSEGTGDPVLTARVRARIGQVHNTFLFDRAQKSVLYGDFTPFPHNLRPRYLLHGERHILPKPPWFVTNRRGAQTARQLFYFTADRKKWRLPLLFFHALRG